MMQEVREALHYTSYSSFMNGLYNTDYGYPWTWALTVTLPEQRMGGMALS